MVWYGNTLSFPKRLWVHRQSTASRDIWILYDKRRWVSSWTPGSHCMVADSDMYVWMDWFDALQLEQPHPVSYPVSHLLPLLNGHHDQTEFAKSTWRRAEVGDRLVTIEMGRNVGADVPHSVEGRAGSPSYNHGPHRHRTRCRLCLRSTLYLYVYLLVRLTRILVTVAF